jgi:NAD(P)-dependent dehydrogenase (short-subunit alcohol dehydrogenase family)
VSAQSGALADQVALIFGAAGGIGRAVVRRYLREGALVFAIDRKADSLAQLAREAPSPERERLSTLEADAADWSACEKAVASAAAAHGRIDVVVSCVGIYDHAIRLADIPGHELPQAFDECLRVNVGSMLFCIKAALPMLIKSHGRIVLTSSVASYTPSGGGVLYTASKHAVNGIIAQLAYELAPHVRVNGVAPGVARTIMSGLTSLGQSPRPSLLPGSESALPLGNVPDTDAYGAAYAMLGSATESSAMTGTTIVVDSGILIRGIGRSAPASGRST